ncbi:MAG: hypothetical protein DBX96_04200 [Propionibacterium sp.]|nr:MAG: hypothetical protein DBX96_04200 [Propionibacterium sp.]
MAPASNPANGTGSHTSDAEISDKERFFVQAPVAPLREDRLIAFTIGTVVFIVLAIAAYFWRVPLGDAGLGWWFWVAVSGAVIGVLAISYGILRRRRMGQTRTTASDAAAKKLP